VYTIEALPTRDVQAVTEKRKKKTEDSVSSHSANSKTFVREVILHVFAFQSIWVFMLYAL
jgi:hypothetical protein